MYIRFEIYILKQISVPTYMVNDVYTANRDNESTSRSLGIQFMRMTSRSLGIQFIPMTFRSLGEQFIRMASRSLGIQFIRMTSSSIGMQFMRMTSISLGIQFIQMASRSLGIQFIRMVIFQFVDIGGINGLHCLNFPLIIWDMYLVIHRFT